MKEIEKEIIEIMICDDNKVNAKVTDGKEFNEGTTKSIEASRHAKGSLIIKPVELVTINDSVWPPGFGTTEESSHIPNVTTMSKLPLKNSWQSAIRDQLNNMMKLGLQKHFKLRVRTEGKSIDKLEFVNIEVSKRSIENGSVSKSQPIRSSLFYIDLQQLFWLREKHLSNKLNKQ